MRPFLLTYGFVRCIASCAYVQQHMLSGIQGDYESNLCKLQQLSRDTATKNEQTAQ